MDKGALSLNALFDPMFFSTRGRLPPGNAECSKTCLWSSPNFCETFVQLLKLGLTSLSSRSNTEWLVFAPDIASTLEICLRFLPP